MESPLQQAGVGGAGVRQAEGLPEAQRHQDAGYAEGVATRGAEPAGHECGRRGELGERAAQEVRCLNGHGGSTQTYWANTSFASRSVSVSVALTG